MVTLAMPWFAARVAAELLNGQVPDQLLLAWVGMLGLQALVGFGSSLLSGTTGARVAATLGTRVYDHLQSLPLSWHQQRKRGEILALLHNDVWRMSNFLTGTLTPLLPLLLTCVGALILLTRIQPGIGIVVGLSVPVLVLGLKLATRQLRPLADASMREDAVKHGIAAQNLGILPIIKAFTREDEESARFAVQSETVRDLGIRQLRITAALTPAVRWVAATAVIALLWLGGNGIARGSISPPDLIGMLLYGLLLTHPVSQLAGAFGQLQTARGAARRLLETLGESVETDTGKRELRPAHGDISFERVSFSYPGRATLFTALEFKISAGETVAITGLNGSGKSTVAHLLMRFMDPSSGRIKLDGVDLRELSLQNLRSHIGLVSQNVLLFNSTVSENIAYGRPGATPDEIALAARNAHAHDFISRLPMGYDTMVGDDGVRLSGGQKQRVALARALLKDPAILIMDEATAMFDPEGERGFIAECHHLMKERTVLLITHRPASLALADRVLRLENGQFREISRC